MGAIYRESRILRGLDPNGDDRPRGVGEWKTVADVLVVPEPERELAAIGARANEWSVDDDDIPFD